MVPVAHIVRGIILAIKFHMRWITVIRSLYFKTFSASFLISFIIIIIIIIIIIVVVVVVIFVVVIIFVVVFFPNNGFSWEREWT
jgi:hypothetical protein